MFRRIILAYFGDAGTFIPARARFYIIMQKRCWNSRFFCYSHNAQAYYHNLVSTHLPFCVETCESDKNVHHIRLVLSKTSNAEAEDVAKTLCSDEICDRMQLSDEFVSDVIQRFGDDWKSALGFFQWTATRPGYKLNSCSYDKMVDLLGKMKQMTRMWDLVNDMKSKGIVTKETISKTMRRLSGAGKWQDAIKIFDSLESLGLQKDTETMNILLETLCKENKVESAREVFLKLKDSISPDAFTFNIFVHGWCKSRKIDEAEWTILEMKGYGFQPSVITYSTILHSYCNQSNFHKAYELLDTMKNEGCPPNIITYTGILHKIADTQDMVEVYKLIKKMKSARIKPDVVYYNCLIKVLGRAGRISEASHVYDVEMSENGVVPNLATYNSLISVSCQHSLKENALKILKKMELVSCKPDHLTYIPLFKLCFKMGETDGRLNSLLDDMVNKHHLSLDSASYTLLIHGFCEAGKLKRALFLFEEMIHREIPLRKRTYKFLSEEAENKGLYNEIERINKLMKKMGSDFFDNKSRIHIV